MEMATVAATAAENLMRLRHNPYPGRGIVVGQDESGNIVQIYWIMGRSENSRNRVFAHDDRGKLWTEPADPSKVKDPSLIIYTAMNQFQSSRCHVVSNGQQTDDMNNIWLYKRGILDELDNWQYEPDDPNFTPRITAACSVGDGEARAEIVVLRRSIAGDHCERLYYHYPKLINGYGYCVTTYQGDGDPLPSFRGEPYLLPLEGSPMKILELYWDSLNHENRVAIALKLINPLTGESVITTINRYNKVAS